jgi:hypothetical protein
MILYYMHSSHLSVKTLRDEQAGFRKECPCVDQIATLRIIVELTQSITIRNRRGERI